MCNQLEIYIYRPLTAPGRWSQMKTRQVQNEVMPKDVFVVSKQRLIIEPQVMKTWPEGEPNRV